VPYNVKQKGKREKAPAWEAATKAVAVVVALITQYGAERKDRSGATKAVALADCVPSVVGATGRRSYGAYGSESGCATAVAAIVAEMEERFAASAVVVAEDGYGKRRTRRGNEKDREEDRRRTGGGQEEDRRRAVDTKRNTATEALPLSHQIAWY